MSWPLQITTLRAFHHWICSENHSFINFHSTQSTNFNRHRRGEIVKKWDKQSKLKTNYEIYHFFGIDAKLSDLLIFFIMDKFCGETINEVFGNAYLNEGWFDLQQLDPWETITLCDEPKMHLTSFILNFAAKKEFLLFRLIGKEFASFFLKITSRPTLTLSLHQKKTNWLNAYLSRQSM